MYFKNCCNFVNVIWNTLRFWLNNDNNDDIHAGAKNSLRETVPSVEVEECFRLNSFRIFESWSLRSLSRIREKEIW